WLFLALVVLRFVFVTVVQTPALPIVSDSFSGVSIHISRYHNRDRASYWYSCSRSHRRCIACAYNRRVATRHFVTCNGQTITWARSEERRVGKECRSRSRRDADKRNGW